MAERDASTRLDPGSRRWVLAATAACLLPLLLQLPLRLGLLIGATAVLVAVASWRKPLHGLLRLVLALGLLAAVMLLAGFNFGRDTGCAVLAAMLAVKPSETFTLRDARSLVGFALFAPFGTFLLDQGPLALALGLFGALLALGALQRLTDLESGDPVRIGAGRRFASIGRLLAIGLPLALAAFWLFPRLATPMWGVPERAIGKPGLSGEMSPGQWLDLIADDSPALRVRFFGDTPPQSEMYWRGPVLWDFDGTTWTRSEWLSGLPPAPVRHGEVRWDYEMEVEPTERRRFVSLELPVSQPGGTRLTHDYEIYASRPLTSLTRWRMQSAPPVTHEAELRPMLRRLALDLPDGFNPRTLQLAREWRAQAGKDDAAIVQRALSWIRAEFAYTLTTPPASGPHGVDEFLFDQQAGFCEHYSSAFVVLMRGAGIPSRVVTGYVGGYRNPLGDYWLVRRSDAHAWAEVWLEGRGWVRVDPTAAVAPERIYDTIDDRRPGADMLGGMFGVGTGLFDYTDWLRRGWNDFVLGFDAERQARLLQPLGINRTDGVTLGLLFAVVALVALLWMVWLSRRGERQPDPVLRAWHVLERRYRRLGLGREPSEPALDWAARVARDRPADAEALGRLSRRFSDWRYAGDHAGVQVRRSLIRDLRAHRPR